MKQVIVVNEALKLPRGKLAAQVAHAAVAAMLWANDDTVNAWLDNGMPKVVLRADTESDLLKLHEVAKTRHLPAELIADAGRTVLEPGTITCLGIGPAEDDEIDAVTGDLKLLR